MSLYEKAWQAVAVRIAAAAQAASRDPASIRVLAVSKTVPGEAIRAAYTLGQRAFGENYVQEASTKMATLSDLAAIEWHLIGPLQSNKARLAAANFAWVQTVDRARIAERLAAARGGALAPLNICVQVNISGEASKGGCAPEAAFGLAQAVARWPQLALRGFMGIAEETADNARQRAQFHLLRTLFDRARASGMPVDTLSMGMSADMEAAIAEGSTLVRIGTALFGARPKKLNAGSA
jgi:pyridoxal phosphate enzyme (YggS family)